MIHYWPRWLFLQLWHIPYSLQLLKQQHSSAMQEPLLFSKCCYHNLTFRTSDKNRLQTLQAVEKMVDKHRMGCCIYMQLAEKLNLEACQPFQDLRRSMQLASVPHVKLLKRITEPSLPERISSLVDVKMNSQTCQTASTSQVDSM